MSRGALYFDEDSGAANLMTALRRHGEDVLSAAEAGMLGASDAEQLAFASAKSRALVTFNVRDFARIHNTWVTEGRTHAGIIVFAQWRRLSVGERMRRLIATLDMMDAERLRNGLYHLHQ